MKEKLFEYIMRMGDDAVILGQRLSEWCGHGPVLEQDIAMTNIALDHFGRGRSLYQYAAKVEEKGHTEDDLAMYRDGLDFKNLLMLELPNDDWGFTLVREFLYDTYNYFLFDQLRGSRDDQLKAIADKSMKEITYHAQFSAEWIIRLGDGTEESHERVQKSLDDIWMYTGEMFVTDELDKEMAELGIGADLAKVKEQWHEKVAEILDMATLQKPEDGWMQSGGRQGHHTEHLGYILTEMQFLQRAYPDAEW